MTTDDRNPVKPTAPPTPPERFSKLAKISPLRRFPRPRPMLVIAVVIAVALAVVVCSAYEIWVPAAKLIDSYTRRIWAQIF